MFSVRPSVRKITSALIFCLAWLPLLAVEQELPLDYRLNERIVLVPAGPNGEAMLETTVFKPNGAGPFPLLIINHGKEAGAPNRQQRDRFIYMATAFVKRGYAVMVPMRQGFANSTGKYRDHGCDMTANGYAQADDILAAVNYARAQDWVDGERIVVAGQSYGGLATIALGTQELPGVRGLINFAGGLRDDSNHCDWSSQLVKAFGAYGANNKLSSLWMYGVNDSLFKPELVLRMHDAFVRNGGSARLIEFAAFKRDAHGMIASRDGEQVWWRETEHYLQRIGMPTRELYSVLAAPALPKSNFAALDDIAAVPYLSENGRSAYREYLAKLTPRAFAVAPNGAWCWAEDGENPGKRALATCQQESGQPCQLYSVDEQVVWPDQPATATASGAATIAATASGGSL
jgi:dienelactone hydrolase